jgi:hypothetical protein
VAPDTATLDTPFPRRQLATFVRGHERLQDVEWGGVSGFDDLGETPLLADAGQAIFHVLEPPQEVVFLNGPQRIKVSIPLVTRTSGGGGASLIAVDLDPMLGVFVSRVTAVPVFPANELAQRLFRVTRPTLDNLNQLRGYMHVPRMRWVRPENVAVLT